MKEAPTFIEPREISVNILLRELLVVDEPAFNEEKGKKHNDEYFEEHSDNFEVQDDFTFQFDDFEYEEHEENDANDRFDDHVQESYYY